ncbi:MAG: hypothetical protein ACFCUR_09765 [Rhodomicrobiaceae bacterium]
MLSSAPHMPISYRQRQAIRRLLIRFMKEYRSADGKRLSAESCANYISESTGVTISKSVIAGYIENKSTNSRYVANIRNFLLSIYTEVDPETLCGSRTKQATITLARLVSAVDDRPERVRAEDAKPPFENLRLRNLNTSGLNLTLSNESIFVLMPQKYGIFQLTARLYLTDLMKVLSDASSSVIPQNIMPARDQILFTGHAARHGDQLTGIIFDHELKLTVWINIAFGSATDATLRKRARLIQISGNRGFSDIHEEFDLV